MRRHLDLDLEPERTNPRILERLGILLIGLGIGHILPALSWSEQELKGQTAESHPVAVPAVAIKRDSGASVGFALIACYGREIPNARGGWSVVFEPGEC